MHRMRFRRVGHMDARPKCGQLRSGVRPMATERRELDRALLRQAGEHLGTLAEQQKESFDFYAGNHQAGWTREQFTRRWKRYTKLARLSKEVLEVAHGH
jgi:hypothetical protein